MTHKNTGILISWTTGLCGVMTAMTARILCWRGQWGGVVFTVLVSLVLLHLSFKIARAVERLYPRS